MESYNFKYTIQDIVKSTINIDNSEFQMFIFMYYLPTFKKFKRKELLHIINIILKNINNQLKYISKNKSMHAPFVDYHSFSDDLLDSCILRNKDIQGYASNVVSWSLPGKLLKPVSMQISGIIEGVGFKLMYSALRKSIITYFYLLYVTNADNSISKDLAIEAYQESIKEGLVDIGNFFL